MVSGGKGNDPLGETRVVRQRNEQELRRRIADLPAPRQREFEEASRSDVFTPYVPRRDYADAPGAVLAPRTFLESRSLGGVPYPELTAQPSPGLIDALNRKAIAIEQADGVLLLDSADDAGHGALIADDVGTGKSRIIAGTIDQWFHRNKAQRVIVITRTDDNTRDLEDQFRIFYGIGEDAPLPYSVLFADNFNQTSTANAIKKGKYEPFPATGKTVLLMRQDRLMAFEQAIRDFKPDAVIADEAHGLKNVDEREGSGRGLLWKDLHRDWLSRGVHLAYFTATPAVSVGELEYMYGLREWDIDSFPDWIAFKTGRMTPEAYKQRKDARDGKLDPDQLPGDDMGSDGADVVRNTGGGRGFSYGDDVYVQSVAPAEMEQIMRELKMLGKFRSTTLWRGGTEYRAMDIPLTEAEKEHYRRAAVFINRVLDAAEKWGRMNARFKNIGLMISQAQQALKRLQFDFRLTRSMDIAEEDLKAGIQPIISLLYVNETSNEKGSVRSIIDMINTRHVVRDEGEFVDYGEIDEATAEKFELLELLATEFPPLRDPIEAIEHRFGPENVASIIGGNKKTRRLVMEDFQAGRRKVAVISSAGSTGINLHHVVNTPEGAHGRRDIILADYDWSAIDFWQRLGRGDRAGQLTAPYLTPVSLGAAAERKFLSTIAIRMKSVGAVSSGSAESRGNTPLEAFEGGGAVDVRAIEEAWSKKYFPVELREWFRGREFRDPNNPERASGFIHGVGMKKFLLNIMRMPIEDGNLVWHGFEKRRDELMADNALLEELAAARTAKSHGKIKQVISLQPQLDMYVTEDADGHMGGVLVGMLTPQASEIRALLGKHRREWVTFHDTETGEQASGIRVPASLMDWFRKRLGSADGAVRTPEDAMLAIESGQHLELSNGWKLYAGSGPREGRIVVDGASLKNTDRGAKFRGLSVKFSAVGGYFSMAAGDKATLEKFLKRWPLAYKQDSGPAVTPQDENPDESGPLYQMADVSEPFMEFSNTPSVNGKVAAEMTSQPKNFWENTKHLAALTLQDAYTDLSRKYGDEVTGSFRQAVAARIYGQYLARRYFSEIQRVLRTEKGKFDDAAYDLLYKSFKDDRYWWIMDRIARQESEGQIPDPPPGDALQPLTAKERNAVNSDPRIKHLRDYWGGVTQDGHRFGEIYPELERLRLAAGLGASHLEFTRTGHFMPLIPQRANQPNEEPEGFLERLLAFKKFGGGSVLTTPQQYEARLTQGRRRFMGQAEAYPETLQENIGRVFSEVAPKAALNAMVATIKGSNLAYHKWMMQWLQSSIQNENEEGILEAVNAMGLNKEQRQRLADFRQAERKAPTGSLSLLELGQIVFGSPASVEHMGMFTNARLSEIRSALIDALHKHTKAVKEAKNDPAKINQAYRTLNRVWANTMRIPREAEGDYVMPTDIRDAYRNLVEFDPPGAKIPAPVLKAGLLLRNLAVSLRLFTPSELVYHMNRYLSRGVGVLGQEENQKMKQAAYALGLGKLMVWHDFDGLFNSKEGQEAAEILARYGGFNPRMMSKYSDALVSILTKIPLVKYPAEAMEFWRSKVFGYGGIDHQLRVAVAVIARRVYRAEFGKDPTPNWVVEFVNGRMGNYFAQMQPALTRFLIESGLDPFAANHVAIIPSEFKDFFGVNGLPNNKGWNRFKAFVFTIVGAGVFLALMNKILGGKWPWENPPGEETSVSLDNVVKPTQDASGEWQHAYLPPTITFPEIARTMSISGAHDVIEDLRLGIPGQIGRDMLRDPTNQVLSMTVGGAPYESLWILATGTAPWINQYGELATYGHKPKTLAGFLPARIGAALASTTSLADRLYNDTSTYGTGKVGLVNKIISVMAPGMAQVNEIELQTRGERFIRRIYSESAASVAYNALDLPSERRGDYINRELQGYPLDDRPTVAAMIADKLAGAYMGGAFREASAANQNGGEYRRFSPDAYRKGAVMYGYERAIRALASASEAIKNSKTLSKEEIKRRRDEIANRATKLLLEAVAHAGAMPNTEPPPLQPGEPPVQ